jgi:hypothetical protein
MENTQGLILHPVRQSNSIRFFLKKIKRLSTPTIGIVVHGILGKKDEYGAGGMEKKKTIFFQRFCFINIGEHKKSPLNPKLTRGPLYTIL